jgi:hypothetical protein
MSRTRRDYGEAELSGARLRELRKGWRQGKKKQRAITDIPHSRHEWVHGESVAQPKVTDLGGDARKTIA